MFALEFADKFWGFWMLGGMSGGGMGFIFDPTRKAAAQDFLQQAMTDLQTELRHALPFAMPPVVYDFAINPHGTFATLHHGPQAPLPAGYYAMAIPPLLRADAKQLSKQRRIELARFGSACRDQPELSGMVQTIFDRLFARNVTGKAGGQNLQQLLAQNGFDPQQHEKIRAALRHGRIGLAQNRLPTNTTITDVESGDVIDTRLGIDERYRQWGTQLLAEGAVGVVSLAAGAEAAVGRKAPGSLKRSIPSANSAAGTAPSSRRTWPRVAASATKSAKCRRICSPPAT